MKSTIEGYKIVFPTGVGMNRAERSAPVMVSSVPHRRGDEPALEKN